MSAEDTVEKGEPNIGQIYIRIDYFEVWLGMVEQSRGIKLKALKEMDYHKDA